MDLRHIERGIDEVADVAVIDPRVVRQVIKRHRDASGVVPHDRCYAIRRKELATVASQGELGLPDEASREWVVLVAKPSTREAKYLGSRGVFDRTHREAFHARVHVELESKVAEGRLDEAVVRQRVEELGRAEFEEIRATLAHDDLLHDSNDDVEVYIEFCALYLELLEFSPALIIPTFPGLAERERIEAVIGHDIAVGSLLSNPEAESRPPKPKGATTAPPPKVRSVSAWKHARLLSKAEKLCDARDHARGAVLAARAACTEDEGKVYAAEQTLRGAVDALSQRLRRALHDRPSEASTETSSWEQVVEILARHAATHRGASRSPEALLLRTLESAAVAHEQQVLIVDVPAWITSRGRRPVVRPRQASRELEVARKIERAADRMKTLGLPSADREKVTAAIETAVARAEENVRAALRPKIMLAVRQAGLRAASGPERHARKKLVEELVDEVVARGFFSLPQLRDAISRNAAKLRDLSGPRELVSGDPLLLADRKLDASLDGIYRRGEIYLRGLQKGSSVAFGTRLGRLLTLYLILPLLGSFVVLEGIRYIVGPLVQMLGFGSIRPLTPISFFATAAVILALLHSELARIAARQFLDGVGRVLAFIFLRIPRAVLAFPRVRQWLENRTVRLVLRRFVVPLTIAAGVYFATVLSGVDAYIRYSAALGTFGVMTLLMASSIGWWLEGLVLERLAPTWQVVSRRWLPEVLSLIGRAFARMMEAFERALFGISDALRYRRTNSRAILGITAVAGAVWAVVAYVLRLYMTLLIEPEINPLKHFPIVTVAHKLMLPFLPELLDAIEPPLMIFGPIVGGAIAGLTVFLLPSVFGFLGWELKANYKLYRATRSKTVTSTRFGPHGETMRELLVPGVHSGTLPKLYERLRRAAQRHDERWIRQRRHGSPSQPARDEAGLARFREGLRVVRRALDRFVERELLRPLITGQRWALGRVAIQRIDLSSNRIRMHLVCAGSGPEPCTLTFEQLGGRIVARISRAGFVAELDQEHARWFENALAVFYHRAAVDLVREQLERELGHPGFEIEQDGLVVWPEAGVDTELVYPLDLYRPRSVAPKGQGPASFMRKPLDSRQVLYTHQPITWQAWEQTWETASRKGLALPSLLSGRSILPRVTTTTASDNNEAAS